MTNFLAGYLALSCKISQHLLLLDEQLLRCAHFLVVRHLGVADLCQLRTHMLDCLLLVTALVLGSSDGLFDAAIVLKLSLAMLIRLLDRTGQVC